MKLEIKLNQEQFDLLVTSLVQIAQNSVKMAEAWAPKEEPVNMELLPETPDKTEPKRNYQYRSDSWIYNIVWGIEPGKYKGYKAHLLRQAIEKTGAKMMKKNHTTYVLHEDAQKVIDWMNKHLED